MLPCAPEIVLYIPGKLFFPVYTVSKFVGNKLPNIRLPEDLTQGDNVDLN